MCLYNSHGDSFAAKDQENPRIPSAPPNPRVFGDGFSDGNAPSLSFSNLTDQPLFGTNTSSTAATTTAAIHLLCPCCSTYHPAAIPRVFGANFDSPVLNSSATPRTFRDVFSDRIAASNTAAFPSFSNLPPLSNHQPSLFGTNISGGGSAAFPSFSNLPPLSNHQPSLFGSNTSGGGGSAAFPGFSNLPPLSNHQPSLFGTNTSGGGGWFPPKQDQKKSIFSSTAFPGFSNLPPLSNHQPSLFGTNTSGGGGWFPPKQDQEKSIFSSTAFPVPNFSATPRSFFVNYNAASKFSNTSAAFPSLSKVELPKSTHPLFGTNTSATTTAAINPLWSGHMNFCPCCGQRNVTNAAAYPPTTAAIPQLIGGGFGPLFNANTAFSFSNSPPISKPEPAKFTYPFCTGSCCGVHGNRTTKAVYRPTYDESSSAGNILSISAMCVYPAKSHEELRWDDYSSQGKSCWNPSGLRGSAQTNSTSFGGGVNTGCGGCFSNPNPEAAQPNYPPIFPTSTDRPSSLFQSSNYNHNQATTSHPPPCFSCALQ